MLFIVLQTVRLFTSQKDMIRQCLLDSHNNVHNQKKKRKKRHRTLCQQKAERHSTGKQIRVVLLIRVFV